MRFFVLCLCVLAWPAQAALNVFACEPEWAALASELGGERVQVYAATSVTQDVHHIEARPSLMARMRNADLLVCTGLELESGWLPVLLQQSGNARIQPGQSGFFEAGQFVPRLEIPTVLDRSLGDIHASGNPHIHLDPRNIGRVALALTERLIRLEPAQADFYRQRGASFTASWQASIARWEKSAAPLKGVPVVTHHKDMVYLSAWLGLQEVAQLEPKPGVAPSTAHLASLVDRLRQKPARMILRAPYQDGRAAQWLAGQTGIPALVLPYSVGGEARTLTSLFDLTIRKLLDAAR
jgi:zinc/manganese transport system substrate-binding protein